MFGILNVCEALISRVRSISDAKVVILLKESTFYMVPRIFEVVRAWSHRGDDRLILAGDDTT